MIVGLGIDLVEVERMRALVERHGARARSKLFTPLELAHADRRSDPIPALAARFAAKEAAFKALAGTPEARRIGWRDMEVVNDPDGRPTLRFHGPAAERARAMGVATALVTLTHTHLAAAATVILVTAPGAAPAPPADPRR